MHCILCTLCTGRPTAVPQKYLDCTRNHMKQTITKQGNSRLENFSPTDIARVIQGDSERQIGYRPFSMKWKTDMNASREQYLLTKMSIIGCVFRENRLQQYYLKGVQVINETDFHQRVTFARFFKQRRLLHPQFSESALMTD